MQISHSSINDCVTILLNEITRLALVLDELHIRCEQGCNERVDREICKISTQLDQTYDKAIRAGVVVGAHYRTRLAGGTAYVLCLTQWGVECRLRANTTEWVA